MSFRESLDRWPSRSTVRGAAVVSEDGLLIHDALGAGVDGEAVAALSVVLLREASQLGHAARGGRLGTAVFELEQGPALVTAVDDRHTLVVLAQPDRDLGPLLLDIRREKSNLRQVI